MFNNEDKLHFALYQEGYENRERVFGEELNIHNISKYVHANYSSSVYPYESLLVWMGSSSLKVSEGWSLIKISDLGLIDKDLEGIEKLNIRYRYRGSKNSNTHKQNHRNYHDSSRRGFRSSLINDQLLAYESRVAREKYGVGITGRKTVSDKYADLGLRSNKSKGWKTNKCLNQWNKHKKSKKRGLRDKWEIQAWYQEEEEKYLEELASW